MLNQLTQDKNTVIRIVLTDTLSITLIYFIPVISHLSPFPLYYSEPMRLVAIAAYFASRNKWNAYLLALTLHVFSLAFSGHPTFFKASLISVELFLNMLLLDTLIQNLKWKTFLALVISISVSKIFYYAMKYIFISISLLQGNLISIPIPIQMASVAITASFYFILINIFHKNKP
jgi:hypothetical protein